MARSFSDISKLCVSTSQARTTLSPMCRHSKSCVLLGGDSTAWSKLTPLAPPAWLDEQLTLFREAAEATAVGNRSRAIEFLGYMKSQEMRVWFEEHGQFSGKIRAEYLSLPNPKPGAQSLDPVRSPARFEKQVFHRDAYTCRYCGLKLLAKETLVAFEQAVGPQYFRTRGTNAQQHGIVHAFKIVADHVFPHKYGGKTSLENLVSACPSCNYGKYWYTTEQMGIDDPLSRQPTPFEWSGLASLVTGLRSHALQ
jgi:hypothetical protein